MDSSHPTEGDHLPTAEIIPFRRPEPQVPDLSTGFDTPGDDDDGGGPTAA